jgi:hypothetical protein
MRTLTLELVTDGFATAVLRKRGGRITLEVDSDLAWDRDGLLKLSAALRSAAEMLSEEKG